MLVLIPASARGSREVQSGKTDLTLAICACITILMWKQRAGSDPQAAKSRIETAEREVWEDLENPTIERIQALKLLTRYRAESGNSRRSFMLAGLAARPALAL